MGRFDQAFSPGDVLRRLRTLERQVRELVAGRRLEDATIASGGIRVRSPLSDTNLLLVGEHRANDPSGQPADIAGLVVRRPNGALSLWAAGTADGDLFWALYDLTGNILTSDDIVARQGLARPYIPTGAWAPGDPALWPSVTTTGDFVDQWFTQYFKQHPRLQVAVWVISDGDGAGDVRVSAPGSEVVEPVTAGQNVIHNPILDVPGAHLSAPLITISLRRISGTGSIRCYPIGFYGVQS